MYAEWLHAAAGATISTVQVFNLPDRQEHQALLGHVDGGFNSDCEDDGDDAVGIWRMRSSVISQSEVERLRPT